ncbi:MAG: class I SAM-dependent methyltransferase [Sulfuritalea sp.]|nr:class I SAM-dependent methyltransferase [Sulfuritalea sp.]
MAAPIPWPMTPADYDAWYETPRGHWIGAREFALLAGMLATRPGETLLDVGCGTGWFSRRFAREAGLIVTGVDIADAALDFARDRSPHIAFARADAARLPFADGAFDYVVAVTSLCFVAEEDRAVREMARVARRRVALGLLNRRSLLHWQRGKSAGYAGARWHERAAARALLADAGIERIQSASAVFLPSGGALAQALEERIPASLALGGFLAFAGEPLSAGTQARQGNGLP